MRFRIQQCFVCHILFFSYYRGEVCDFDGATVTSRFAFSLYRCARRSLEHVADQMFGAVSAMICDQR